MAICDDILTRLLLSVFIGWIFIILYVIKCISGSIGSSNNSGKSDSSYTGSSTGSSYNKQQDSFSENHFRKEYRADEDPIVAEPEDYNFSDRELADYYGYQENSDYDYKRFLDDM